MLWAHSAEWKIRFFYFLSIRAPASFVTARGAAQYKLSQKNRTQLSDYLLLWHPLSVMLFRETKKKPLASKAKGQSPVK
jgi:hypothetical protein